MQRRLTLAGYVVGAGLLLILAGARVQAHHAFAAEFDANKPIQLKGTITRLEWVNPHSWLHIDVKKADGTVEQWMIEGGPPTSLLRRGFTKKSLEVGTEVNVSGFMSKDHACRPICRGNGRDITFNDGRKLFMGSSGTGAPDDGKDPTEAKKK
jgi:Family of unknown function (DUF6152)